MMEKNAKHQKLLGSAKKYNENVIPDLQDKKEMMEDKERLNKLSLAQEQLKSSIDDLQNKIDMNKIVAESFARNHSDQMKQFGKSISTYEEERRGKLEKLSNVQSVIVANEQELSKILKLLADLRSQEDLLHKQVVDIEESTKKVKDLSLIHI